MKKLFLTILFCLLLHNMAWCATKYLRNVTGNLNDANSYSTTGSGGDADTTVGGADDDIICDASFTGSITITANQTLNSFVCATGAAGTITHNSAITLTIDGQDGSGNSLLFVSTMTYTLLNSATSAITFTGAGTSKITSGTKTLGNVTINNSGDTFQQQDALTCASIVLTAGTWDSNDYALNVSGNISGNASVDFGTSTVTLSGATSSLWPCNGGTMSAATIVFSAANYTGSGVRIQTDNSDLSIGTVTANGSGIFYFGNNGAVRNITIATFNRTGTAVKTDSINLNTNLTVTGTLNIDGNSGINRLLVYSNTLGTARTLTLTGATISGCSNVDFRDIAFVSTGAVDFSAITGGSGDCGGNTISGGGTISFTTADDWYWYSAGVGAGTYNFSDYTYWYTATAGGGSQMASTRTILPQDKAYFDADSVSGSTTVDQDLPRIPGIDFTGVDAMNFHTDNVGQEIYGGITMASNVTFLGGKDIIFKGRSSYILDSLGKLGNGTFYQYIQMVGGTLTLASNYNWTANRSLILTHGTLTASSYDCAGGGFTGTGATTRVLNMGSGTWTVGGAFVAPWDITTSTNMTLNCQTSTIFYKNTSTAYTFYGGNFIYNNLTLEAGAGTVLFSGSNTFNTFTINAPKTVKFTAGTTQTVSSFVATGDASNLIHIDSTSASAATLSDSAGTNTVHYCHIGETGSVNATGGAVWDATDNCNVNASTGWTTAGTTSYVGEGKGIGILHGIGVGVR